MSRSQREFNKHKNIVFFNSQNTESNLYGYDPNLPKKGLTYLTKIRPVIKYILSNKIPISTKFKENALARLENMKGKGPEERRLIAELQGYETSSTTDSLYEKETFLSQITGRATRVNIEKLYEEVPKMSMAQPVEEVVEEAVEEVDPDTKEEFSIIEKQRQIEEKQKLRAETNEIEKARNIYEAMKIQEGLANPDPLSEYKQITLPPLTSEQMEGLTQEQINLLGEYSLILAETFALYDYTPEQINILYDALVRNPKKLSTNVINFINNKFDIDPTGGVITGFELDETVEEEVEEMPEVVVDTLAGNEAIEADITEEPQEELTSEIVGDETLPPTVELPEKTIEIFRYHPIPIIIFFKSKDNPFWDRQLESRVMALDITEKETVELMEEVLVEYSDKIHVQKIKSKTKKELNELLQLAGKIEHTLELFQTASIKLSDLSKLEELANGNARKPYFVQPPANKPVNTTNTSTNIDLNTASDNLVNAIRTSEFDVTGRPIGGIEGPSTTSYSTVGTISTFETNTGTQSIADPEISLRFAEDEGIY